MTDHWTARQRDDGYFYVEQDDGTAILATIGTPANDRERVARLAALAPKMLAALKMYADRTLWSDSASERMEPDGPWGHDGDMDWTAEVELPCHSLFDGFDGDGWELAEEVLSELEAQP